MAKKRKPFIVVDEGDYMYNVLCIADFDEEGYYGDHKGEDGYHISDFDIVAEFNHFKDAEKWIDKHSKY